MSDEYTMNAREKAASVPGVLRQVNLTREHLETFTFDPHRAAEDEVAVMALELINARGRIAELEAEREAVRTTVGTFMRITDREGADAAARVAELETANTRVQTFYERARRERSDALAVVDRVRAALARHPRCDIHPDDDVISCGWKLAVADVQRALEVRS